MTHPLLSLAREIERRRGLRVVADIQHNAHIARDVGLPYRPEPKRSITLW